MTYRPICDTWILARSKVKFYGAYPSGFLHRARALLGVALREPVLHLCGGRVRDYPYDGFGPNDLVLDSDATLVPDLVCNVVDEEAWRAAEDHLLAQVGPGAVLADPPYTEEDARQYNTWTAHPERLWPSARLCLERGLSVIGPGDRVGILHYVAPRPPKGVKFVALVTIFVGFENRARLYSVYEKR